MIAEINECKEHCPLTTIIPPTRDEVTVTLDECYFGALACRLLVTIFPFLSDIYFVFFLPLLAINNLI
jgi:hypothetical protein